MKKILSILLVSVILMLTFSVCAYASIYDDIPETEYKYYDKVKEYVYGYDADSYRELYYYNNNNTEPDWVLIVCQVMPEPLERKYGVSVGNRVLWTMGGSGLSRVYTGFTVYIPKLDKFIDLDNNSLVQVVELCPQFIETIEENELGQMLGDVSEDGVLDILDATQIQIRIAGYKDYYLTNVQSTPSGEFSICDLDRDGDISVLDATAIQLKLAKVE